MSSISKSTLLSLLLLSLKSTLTYAQKDQCANPETAADGTCKIKCPNPGADGSCTWASGITTIPAPNYNKGFCYYCASDQAPPLCNSQCSKAIESLCSHDLADALSATVQDCEIKYMPPVWPFFRYGSRPPKPSPDECKAAFNGILADCGRDASTMKPAVPDPNYCTSSGGGGTYGWNDDGSVMEGTSRYVITTKGSNQCGQAKASWHQATSVIQWNDSWVGPNDEVKLDTNPPSVALPAATDFPKPNPICDTEECDIFDNPYYAKSTKAPWDDGKKGQMRHQIAYSGFATEDPRSHRLFKAIHDRCQYWPDNWQNWKNDAWDGWLADLNLPSGGTASPSLFVDQEAPSDMCWCLPYALFDAGVGITAAVNSFCDSLIVFKQTEEFKPVLKRGEHIGHSIFREVRGTPEESMKERDARMVKREALLQERDNHLKKRGLDDWSEHHFQSVEKM